MADKGIFHHHFDVKLVNIISAVNMLKIYEPVVNMLKICKPIRNPRLMEKKFTATILFIKLASRLIYNDKRIGGLCWRCKILALC